MLRRSLLISLFAFALPACYYGVVDECADGYVFTEDHEHCVPVGDGGVPLDGEVPRDGYIPGTDAPEDPCAACPQACTAEGVCVECTPTDTAACSRETPSCSASGTCACVAASCNRVDASLCQADGTCGACVADDDCARLTGTPHCGGGTCYACTENAHCAGAAGAYCVEHACVPCTVENEESVCGANSCNVATGECTGTARGSVGLCRGCEADSECMTGYTCAAVNPARGAVGNYCLPLLTSGCERPFFEGVDGATSASGATVDYCRHATTTCEAYLHFRETGVGGACTGTTAPTGTDLCGAVGVDDGACQAGSSRQYRCTYRCGSDDDCKTSFRCEDSGYCSL